MDWLLKETANYTVVLKLTRKVKRIRLEEYHLKQPTTIAVKTHGLLWYFTAGHQYDITRVWRVHPISYQWDSHAGSGVLRTFLWPGGRFWHRPFVSVWTRRHRRSPHQHHQPFVRRTGCSCLPDHVTPIFAFNVFLACRSASYTHCQ